MLTDMEVRCSELSLQRNLRPGPTRNGESSKSWEWTIKLNLCSGFASNHSEAAANIAEIERIFREQSNKLNGFQADSLVLDTAILLGWRRNIEIRHWMVDVSLASGTGEDCELAAQSQLRWVADNADMLVHSGIYELQWTIRQQIDPPQHMTATWRG